MRCDRSLPQCQKCISKGDQCLGYGRLLRWTNAVAVRGKLAEQVGQRPSTLELTGSNDDDSHYGHVTREISGLEVGLPVYAVKPGLIDPLFKDLGPRQRLYISHFSNLVCQDLVSFDQQDHNNPFRSVITLLGSFDYLREIIVATSAVHMVTLRRSHGHPHQRELIDALTAKGRAYRLLRRALDQQLDAASLSIVFIAVVFFINFDLIDSGRGSWKTHIEAAVKLIGSIQGIQGGGAAAAASSTSTSTSTSTTSTTTATNIPPGVAQLADLVMADCVTYHILGAGFSGAADNQAAAAAFAGVDVAATLQRAAPFSYGCYPPPMLDVLSRAARLSAGEGAEAAALLRRLRAVDVRAWVYGIEGLAPNDDREVRVSVACAHRAATCLYVVLAVPDVVLYYPVDMDLGGDGGDGGDSGGGGGAAASAAAAGVEALSREVLYHLASVPVAHSLAKGLIWPTFMAGAQAEDLASRQWCLGRMQRIWQSTPWICPWGYIQSAMNMMQRVWERRDRRLKEGDHGEGMNWLQEVKATADHVLIV